MLKGVKFALDGFDCLVDLVDWKFLHLEVLYVGKFVVFHSVDENGKVTFLT